MSNEIETHRIQRYTDGITLLAQQKKSRLRDKVRNENGVKAKIEFFDQIGSTTMVEKTTRHTDTPIIEIPHRRRAVILKFYHTSDLIDEADVEEVLNEPAGTYGMTMAGAAGRKIDEVILANMFATSKTGEDGTGTAAHPASHQIASNSEGMTLAKMLEAKAILDRSEVDEEDMRFATTRASQIEEMLNITEIGSGDYNTVRALAEGQIDTYAGWKFNRTELVTDDATDTLCPFWAENSMLVAFGHDAKARVDVLPGKDYSTQVYYSMRVGATRMDETGVVRVNCLGTT